MKYYLLTLFCLSIIIASGQNLPQNFTQKPNTPISEDSITALVRLSSQYYNYFKSTKATYQKLDSIIYYSKNTNTQTLNKSLKIMFIYDVNGNIKNESFSNWNSTTNNWVKTYEREYSNNGKTIVVTDYTINSYKKITTLSYNAIGNLILSTSQNWNYNTNQWDDTIRISFNYNTNNLVSSVIKTIYITANNQFVYEYNDVYTYNSNNKLILYEHKSYNFSTQQWQNFNKTEYTLNSKGYKISEVCSEWYPNWELLCKDDFTYDNNGNVSLEFIYFWLTNAWDPDQKLEYQYDNNANMIERRHGGFSSNNQFVYYDRARLTYDSTVSTNQLILPPSLMGQFNNKLTERDGDLASGNSWNHLSKDIYYYSNINITTIETSKQLNIKLFPNPTKDYIQVRVSNIKEFHKSTYEIFNINGQKLLSGEDIYQPIDIRSLNPGLYLMRIIDENTTIISKRFVVSL